MLLVIAAWLALGTLFAQTPTPTPTASPAPSPTPYSLSTIAPQADTALVELTQMQNDLSGDNATDDLHKFVPKLTKNLDKRKERTQEVLNAGAKFIALQDEAANWTVLRDDVSLRLDLLNSKLQRVDSDTTHLAAMMTEWNLTAQSLKGTNAPLDMGTRVNTVLKRISATQKNVDAKRQDLLGLQSTLIEQNTEITGMLDQVSKARGEALSRLPIRDSDPLWRAFSGKKLTAAVAEAAENPMAAQWRLIQDHVVAERGMVTLQIALWVILLIVFRWLQRTVRRMVAAKPELNRSIVVFELPGTVATLIALMIATPFHTGVSPLLSAILDAAMLFPLLQIVKRIIEPPLVPITWALALFYLTTQAREALGAFPGIARLIYFVEMTAGVLFCLWLIKRSQTGEKTLLRTLVLLAARLGFVLFAVADIANILGYFNLALYISTITLLSAYLAVLFYAAAHLLHGLVIFALNTRPLVRLAFVRKHEQLLEGRLWFVIRVAVAALWVGFVLDNLLLLQPAVAQLKYLLTVPDIAGVTFGGLVTFLLTVWASFMVSRLVRFLLEEDVYSRVQLKPGLPFAISTMLHYVILLLGFYLATAALLGDMSKFTVLAGAFGVGVGFGLQNIVNNFVSSIIVLFERPIKIGDLVQVGTQQGTVRQIGIRATIIRSSDGSDVIIPNGKLISDPVTNWTLMSHQRQLQIEVVTPVKGVDADKVISLIEQAALDTKEISKSPLPTAVLESFAANQLRFEVRAWTDEHQNVRRVRSNLAVAISQTMAKNEIPTA